MIVTNFQSRLRIRTLKRYSIVPHSQNSARISRSENPGRDGIEIISSNIGGFHTVMHQGKGAGIGNMNATCQNGKTHSKSPIRLG